MSNMSYCRFENTYNDLNDCYNHLSKEASNERDEKYRLKLRALIVGISEYILEEEGNDNENLDREDFED